MGSTMDNFARYLGWSWIILIVLLLTATVMAKLLDMVVTYVYRRVHAGALFMQWLAERRNARKKK